MNYESIEMLTEGSLVTIKLNRPERMNAVIEGMYLEIQDVLEQTRDESEVRCLIITGSVLRREGVVKQAFCAGADLKKHSAGERNAAQREDYIRLAHETIRKIHEFPKPVIAAINGHCVGEGMVMTLFCDIRIAAYDARFCLPEAKIGVPSINGTIRAVQVANHGAAMELLLTGEPRDADWARMAGFVNTVVPNDELMPTAERMAQNIADNGEEAIQIMRNLGEMALDEKFADLVEEGRKLRDGMQTGDMVGRQAAFVNKDKK